MAKFTFDISFTDSEVIRTSLSHSKLVIYRFFLVVDMDSYVM